MTDTTPSTSARVTRDDVLAALGDTDPTRTNASAIRAILGRGGNSTIQKLLDEIRAERAAPRAALDAAAVAPMAPSALIDAVWSTAWAHAQTLTVTRLDRVTSERDSLSAALDVLRADYAAALADVDALRDTVAQQRENEDFKLGAVSVELEQLREQLAQVRAENLSLTQQREQAAELARRDAELKDAAHRADREHLLNQIAELKALLFRPVP